MKKTISVISALFTLFAILTLTACSGQLSEQEYADRIMPAYKTYVSKLVEAAAMQFTDDSQSSQEELTAALDEASAALDEIEQLNPPAIYSAQHKSVCEAMQYARNELAILKRIAEEGESDELLELLEEAASATDFHDKMLALAKNLREDGYYNWGT